MSQDASATAGSSVSNRKGPLNRLLDLFSSVWFGIALFTAIFIYSTIGSAGVLYPISFDIFSKEGWAYEQLRQRPFFELTEFEWFHWWPFSLLLALFSLTLIVTTIRRIPFRLINAGVLTIHCGILMLIAGSVYYFATKIEGDVPVFRRKVVINVPGAHEVEMLARPGNKIVANGEKGAYSFEIANVQPDWPILSGDDAGKKAYSVSISVSTPDQQFIRQLLAGYPQYTEDIIPGKGRAIKAVGKKLLDESIDLSLAYLPQDRFFIQGTSALYVRRPGGSEWAERPIAGLPHYNDRLSSQADVWPSSSMRHAKFEPINLEVPPQENDDPLSGLDVRVTGYLRYAFEERRWQDGGDRLNPVLGLTFRDARNRTKEYELAAFDPHRSTTEGGQLIFRWVESEQQIEELANAESNTLIVRIPDTNIEIKLPVTEFASNNPELPFRKVEGTDYEFRIYSKVDNLQISQDRSVSVVMLDLRTPEKTFRRMVADDPRSTMDMPKDMGSAGHGKMELDTGIETKYVPPLPLVTIIAGPESLGLTMLLRQEQGPPRRIELEIGSEVVLNGDIKLAPTYFYVNARRETRPWIVPQEQRDRDAGRSYSKIQVALSKPGWEQRMWLPYNRWALPPEKDFRIPGRIEVQTRHVILADGSAAELMFSREQEKLPSAVVLDDFVLQTHQGGLSGQNQNIRDYVSQLRFADASGGWSEQVQMSLNNPANRDGWWFFQSTWDPPMPSQGYAGMNYTGVGVGNRNGVYIQLFGTCVAVAGMLFAFYVKPIILRRRRKAVYDKLEREKLSASPKTGAGAGAKHEAVTEQALVEEEV